MKERIAKLVDLKSIVTLLLVITLIFIVVYSLLTGKQLIDPMFILFSNIVTMVLTYYFTRKKDDADARTETDQKHEPIK